MKLDDILVDGEPLGLCQDKNCLVTPDSGTSYSTMPSWAMTASESRLPLKEGCKSDKGLPQMTYVIDGVQYTLPSERYMERFETADGTTDCQYTVTELDIKQDGQENLFILGD